MGLKIYFESTPKELSNPVHLSIEKLCRVTYHMITLNVCPSSFSTSHDSVLHPRGSEQSHWSVCKTRPLSCPRLLAQALLTPVCQAKVKVYSTTTILPRVP